jgi:lipopolysaccharide transport system permease protein
VGETEAADELQRLGEAPSHPATRRFTTLGCGIHSLECTSGAGMRALAHHDWAHYRELLSVLISTELRTRYHGTVLGVLWSLANPVAFTIALYVAVRVVLRVEIENYPLFLLAGMFPWQWFSNSINTASRLFIGNAPLIKKLPIPKTALCVASVLAEMLHFLVTIPLLAGLAWIATGRVPTSTWWFGVPVLLLVQVVFTVSLVLAISTASAFLRDLEPLLRVATMLLFYLTPILFPMSMVPAEFSWMLIVNPVTPFIICWRELMLEGTLNPYLGVALVHTAIAVALASLVYHRTGWRVPEVV